MSSLSFRRSSDEGKVNKEKTDRTIGLFNLPMSSQDQSIVTRTRMTYEENSSKVKKVMKYLASYKYIVLLQSQPIL